MRELARGKFLVKSEDITLLDNIGEGVSMFIFLIPVYSHTQGSLVWYTRPDWDCLREWWLSRHLKVDSLSSINTLN